jgi:DNA/RNA endonuclease G (NUC1)
VTRHGDSSGGDDAMSGEQKMRELYFDLVHKGHTRAATAVAYALHAKRQKHSRTGGSAS